MHQSEMPPPQPLQIAAQESPPPMPPPLHMETAPPQPPLPSPPALQRGTEIEPQQVPLQIPPESSGPLPPLEHNQQERPPQTLPLPPAMQNTTSTVTSSPPSPGPRPTGAAPVLAAINPTRNNGPVKWSTGLCGCHNDFHNCLITCCCPCITFGQISEIIDRGSSSCVMNGLIYGLLLALLLGCACLYSCTYRERMRRQFNLKGNACGGCCIHFCCELCALSQEYRELKSRGFDLSKGWDAQLEQRTQGVMLAPTTDTAMNR